MNVIRWLVVLAVLVVMFFLAHKAFTQQGNSIVVAASGPPAGTCSPYMRYIDTSSATDYNCLNGIWNKLVTMNGMNGVIVLIDTGSCPTNTTEVAALDGQMLRLTKATNGNVGTTGGSNSITPVFTGTAINFTTANNLGVTGTPTLTGPASITPSGTIAAIDPHPAYTYLIPCKVN